MEKFKIIDAKEKKLIGKLFIETETDNLIEEEPFAGSWTDDRAEFESGIVDLLVKNTKVLEITEFCDTFKFFISQEKCQYCDGELAKLEVEYRESILICPNCLLNKLTK